MERTALNESLARYQVQFDATGIQVAGKHHAFADVRAIHYIQPKKRAAIRFGITAATVALAAWVVLASQVRSPSIMLAVGLLVALTVARFYLLGRVFPKLSLTLASGETVLVMKQFDLIASDRMYAHLREHTGL